MVSVERRNQVFVRYNLELSANGEGMPDLYEDDFTMYSSGVCEFGIGRFSITDYNDIGKFSDCESGKFSDYPILIMDNVKIKFENYYQDEMVGEASVPVLKGRILTNIRNFDNIKTGDFIAFMNNSCEKLIDLSFYVSGAGWASFEKYENINETSFEDLLNKYLMKVSYIIPIDDFELFDLPSVFMGGRVSDIVNLIAPPQELYTNKPERQNIGFSKEKERRLDNIVSELSNLTLRQIAEKILSIEDSQSELLEFAEKNILNKIEDSLDEEDYSDEDYADEDYDYYI